MQIKVSRSILSGKVRPNRSKSYTQRAYAISALAETPSVIRYPSWSDDSRAALRIANNLGALTTIETDQVDISPAQGTKRQSWSVGESGLGLRMFAPIAALQEEVITINGEGSLLTRPVGFIKDALEKVGATVAGEELPLRIDGRVKSGSYTIDGSLSSQLITGLLIALPLLEGESVLHIENPKSTPYIAMTLDIMSKFGVNVAREGFTRFEIPGGQKYSGRDYVVEPDWSGLAFPLVAGALCGNIQIVDTPTSSLQADRAILEILEMSGADMTVGDDEIMIRKSELTAFEYDATDCPDLFPPLAILAARCEGISRIKGVKRLAHKESDRAVVLQRELGKLGVQIAVSDDEMIIAGLQQVNGGVVDACGDHRIAMTLAVAGMIAQRDVFIHGAECIAKSFPDFYADIRDLRGRLEGEDSLFERTTADAFSEDLAKHHE